MVNRLRILRGDGAFRRVFSGRKRFVSSAITFSFATFPSNTPACTVGFSVSSKHYHAVERNYLKRRMREAVRTSIGRINKVLEQHALSMELVMSVHNDIASVQRVTLAGITDDVELFCHFLVTRLSKQ